jgi:ethanolamine utilization protein EutN
VGTKLLIVEKLNEKLLPIGATEIAVDSVGAGTGEIVLVSKGSSARYVLGKKESPIDLAIVGIVDNVKTCN